jgi:hypothetical protein
MDGGEFSRYDIGIRACLVRFDGCEIATDTGLKNNGYSVSCKDIHTGKK